MTPLSGGDAAQHEPDVRGSLAEASHEVREPLPPERHVDPHAVALLHERGLQIPPDAVQHLELERVDGRGRASPACSRATSIIRMSCVAMAG